MSSKRNAEGIRPADSNEFHPVMDALAESIFDTSDKDIRHETIEDGEDPREAAEATRMTLLNAAISHREKNLNTNAATTSAIEVPQAIPPCSKEKTAKWHAALDEVLNAPLYTELVHFADWLIKQKDEAKGVLAEDIVIEAILRLYGRSDLSSVEWMSPDQRMAAISGYLRMMIKQIVMDSLLKAQHLGPVSDCQSKVWTYTVVSSALEMMPPDEREVFLLKYVRGLTYEEISDYLSGPEYQGPSKATLHKRCLRATHRLRRLLEPNLETSNSLSTGTVFAVMIAQVTKQH